MAELWKYSMPILVVDQMVMSICIDICRKNWAPHNVIQGRLKAAQIDQVPTTSY